MESSLPIDRCPAGGRGIAVAAISLVFIHSPPITPKNVERVLIGQLGMSSNEPRKVRSYNKWVDVYTVQHVPQALISTYRPVKEGNCIV